MPQPFNNAVMTNAGAQLLTRAQAGEISIEFTRIAVGNGSYKESEETLAALQARTALKSLKNSYTLSNVEVYSDYSVKVTALITNQDPVTLKTLVTEGYYINEIGLFAKVSGGASGTEVLYSIATTAGENGDFMPPYNGYNPAQITQDYYATVNNSAEITITTTGAAMLYEEANERLMDLEETSETLTYDLADVSTAHAIATFKQVQEDYDEQAEIQTVTLGMNSSYDWPFNNKETTVALSQLREKADYSVDVSVNNYSGGLLGNIVAKDKALNGFKLVHDGSATSVDVTVRVTGGMR